MSIYIANRRNSASNDNMPSALLLAQCCAAADGGSCVIMDTIVHVDIMVFCLT